MSSEPGGLGPGGRGTVNGASVLPPDRRADGRTVRQVCVFQGIRSAVP